MSWLKGAAARLRSLARPGGSEARMDEEFRFHLEMETERLVREGLDPREARRRAVLAFGGVEKHFDEDHSDSPLVWGSFHLFSVGLAMGVAALVGYLLESFFAWPVGGFLFTSAYLLAAGAESTLAYARDHQGEE